MTQNTRAERLRKLIADEDEVNRDEGPMALELAPKTSAALRVFLEYLHAHEVRIGRYHTGCTLCTVAYKMLKEFT